MGEQALAKIVQEAEIDAEVGQLKIQGLVPIETVAYGICCLAVSEPFDRLHHHDQRQVPGRHFNGTPGMTTRTSRTALISR
jgi:hypothetical protein